MRIFTIGHSNRRLAELLDVLGKAHIACLVDVRAQPASRRFPQFNCETLRAALEAEGIAYHWAGRQLGGMRSTAVGSPHFALEGSGLRGYADHMSSALWQGSAVQLMAMAGRMPTAMMCAERDPMRCHRSLIADWMALREVRVIHLIDVGEVRDHVLRSEARRESGALVYDRGVQGELL